VTRWLNDGDLIFLNDHKPEATQALEVLFVPGHTPDSIALYARFEDRLFVGDLIYPYTAIHIDCLGSSFSDFVASIHKLTSFVNGKKAGKPRSPLQQNAIVELEHLIGLNGTLDVAGLLVVCDWSVEAAADLFLSNPTATQDLFPSQNAVSEAATLLSCGHVEANLPSSFLSRLSEFVERIIDGSLKNTHEEEDFKEFSIDNLTVLLNSKQLTGLKQRS